MNKESQDADLSVAALFRVQGTYALVTGGSSGLGLQMAKALLQAGMTVIIASRKQSRCDETLQYLKQYGTCQALAADVTSAKDRSRLVEFVNQTTGATGLSVLVNNAGANWGADIASYPDNAFDKVMSTNVNAVFALSRDLLPALERAASAAMPARIVNIGSMDGLQVPIVQRVPTFAYSASKAAIHHMTRSLAVDLGARHITVNAVAPGFFPSRMTDYVIGEYGDDIAAESLLGRVGEPEEIAGILIYLVSRAGAYTTGTVIPVDGGTHISKGPRSWLHDKD